MVLVFFFNDTATTEIYTLSLHDALPIYGDGWVEFALYGAPGELPSLPEGEADVGGARVVVRGEEVPDDWSERWKRFHTPLRSEEHTSELQSRQYLVCRLLLEKKKKRNKK